MASAGRLGRFGWAMFDWSNQPFFTLVTTFIFAPYFAAVVVGDAVQVADRLQAWFEAGAADGFNILPPTLPDGLTAFNRLVIPELRRRGLFRETYEGSTLREHLGLSRPVSRAAPTPVPALQAS